MSTCVRMLLILALGCGAKSALQVEREEARDGGSRDAIVPRDEGLALDRGVPPDPCATDDPTMLAQLEPNAGLFHVSTDATHAYMAASEQGLVLRVPLCGGALEVIAEDRRRPFYVLSDGEYAYWTDANGAGSVNRAPVGGGPAEELWAEGGQPEGLAMDDEFLYVTVIGIGASAMGLWRVAKDGGDAEALYPAQVGRGVAVHDGWVYFFSPIDQTLFRVPSTGGAPAIVAEGVFTAGTVVVRNGFAYWTAWSGGANVLRAPLPGGPVEVLAEGEPGVVVGLAVTERHVYWSSQRAGEVRGRPLGGGTPTTIAREQETVENLALGPDGALFWVNFGDDRAWRAPPL